MWNFLAFIVLLLASAASWTTVVAADGDDAPSHIVKVIFLAGQSNMVGMAALEHLELLVNRSDTDNEYRDLLWNENTNSFQVRNDVFCKFDDVHGNLTVGGISSCGASPTHFGPELGLGWTIGDHYNNNKNADGSVKQYIVLIKAAYGGRSLAIDFRPPSAGEGDYANVAPSHYGWEYRQMVLDFKAGLDALPSIVPGYQDKDHGGDWSYELSGLAWFQGWNDMLNWDTVNEYYSNLIHLAQDLRREFAIFGILTPTPALPVVVGELGMSGLHPTGRGADRILAMRVAQRNATWVLDNALFVRTAQYAVLDDTVTYNGIYHYYGRADTYFHIGQAMGRGLLLLWNESSTDNDGGDNDDINAQQSLLQWNPLRTPRASMASVPMMLSLAQSNKTSSSDTSRRNG